MYENIYVNFENNNEQEYGGIFKENMKEEKESEKPDKIKELLNQLENSRNQYNSVLDRFKKQNYSLRLNSFRSQDTIQAREEEKYRFDKLM